MKRIVLCGALLVMTFTARIVLAEEITEVSLNRLLDLSGITKQVSNFQAMAQSVDIRAAAGAGNEKLSITDAEITEIKNLISDAFHPSDMLGVIRAELKKNVSESDAKTFLSWYESKLGKRITKAEEDASTPAAYQEMNRTASTLLADEKRVKFAKKLDELLKITDMIVQLQEEAGVVTFIAVSEAMPTKRPANLEAFKTHLSTQRAQTKVAIEQLVIVSLVYSYREIDMTNLQHYADFLERPNTKQFNESAMNGIKIAIEGAIEKMAKSFAVLAKKNHTT